MDMIMGIVRAILAAGGGLMVSKGWTDEGTVETVVGSVMVIATAIWSAVQKAQSHKEVEKARLEMPPVK